MAKSWRLFDQHLTDLRRVSPEADEVFVCPICLSVIPKAEIHTGVDLGHVWPNFLRNALESDVAKHQQVLLCKDCNSKAGSRGDNEMQDFHKARQGLLPKNVTIMDRPSPSAKVTKLKFYMDIEDIQTLDIPDGEPPYKLEYAIRAKRDEWKNNPNWEYFRDLQMSGKSFTMIVEAMPADVNLSFVGWLTSAYLYAFYTFGYQYVLNDTLDPVREIIRQSFGTNFETDLRFQPEKDISVTVFKHLSVPKPQIMYRCEVENMIVPPHLRIFFLDYQVRLPIPLAIEFVYKAKDVPEGGEPFISPNRHTPHHEGSCVWEEIIAKPTYEIVGLQIRKLP